MFWPVPAGPRREGRSVQEATGKHRRKRFGGAGRRTLGEADVVAQAGEDRIGLGQKEVRKELLLDPPRPGEGVRQKDREREDVLAAWRQRGIHERRDGYADPRDIPAEGVLVVDVMVPLLVEEHLVSRARSGEVEVGRTIDDEGREARLHLAQARQEAARQMFCADQLGQRLGGVGVLLKASRSGDLGVTEMETSSLCIKLCPCP